MMPQPAPRTHTALIVSLCVNLLLAGVIAMAAVRHFMQPPEPPIAAQAAQPPERAQMRQLLSPRFLSHVVPEQAVKIREIVDAHHEKMNHLKVESNAARREVLALFGAPVLDKEGLTKALARTQVADAAVLSEVMLVTAEIAPILTPEQRKKAADWHEHHMMGGAMMGWLPGPDDHPHGRD